MLWIRTQDKQRLINVPGVIVNGKKIESVVGKGLLDGLDNNVLGKYGSNDRAFEVLDEVHTKIEENTGISVIYTMPQK